MINCAHLVHLIYATQQNLVRIHKNHAVSASQINRRYFKKCEYNFGNENFMQCGLFKIVWIMLALRLNSTHITLNRREGIYDKYIRAHMHTHRHTGTHFQFKATSVVIRFEKKIDWNGHLWQILLEILANHFEQSWTNEPNVSNVYVSVCVLVCVCVSHILNAELQHSQIHCNIFKWINLIALLEMQLHGNFQFKLCNIVFLTECLPFIQSQFHL